MSCLIKSDLIRILYSLCGEWNVFEGDFLWRKLWTWDLGPDLHWNSLRGSLLRNYVKMCFCTPLPRGPIIEISKIFCPRTSQEPCDIPLWNTEFNLIFFPASIENFWIKTFTFESHMPSIHQWTLHMSRCHTFVLHPNFFPPFSMWHICNYIKYLFYCCLSVCSFPD